MAVMGGSLKGRSPARLAVGPIMAGTAIPMCPTGTADHHIIVIMGITATHIAAIMATGTAGITLVRSAEFLCRVQRWIRHPAAHRDALRLIRDTACFWHERVIQFS